MQSTEDSANDGVELTTSGVVNSTSPELQQQQSPFLSLLIDLCDIGLATGSVRPVPGSTACDLKLCAVKTRMIYDTNINIILLCTVTNQKINTKLIK